MGVTQLVECLPEEEMVAGSNPATHTNAAMVELARQGTANPRMGVRVPLAAQLINC